MTTKDNIAHDDDNKIIPLTDLDSLLKWDGHVQGEQTLDIEEVTKRFGFPLTIRSMTLSEAKAWESSSQERDLRTKEATTDAYKLGMLYGYHCITNVDLSNEKLQKKFNMVDGIKRPSHLIMEKLFRPGEVLVISRAITTLSGFNMDDESINLS